MAGLGKTLAAGDARSHRTTTGSTVRGHLGQELGRPVALLWHVWRAAAGREAALAIRHLPLHLDFAALSKHGERGRSFPRLSQVMHRRGKDADAIRRPRKKP